MSNLHNKELETNNFETLVVKDEKNYMGVPLDDDEIELVAFNTYKGKRFWMSVNMPKKGLHYEGMIKFYTDSLKDKFNQLKCGVQNEEN